MVSVELEQDTFSTSTTNVNRAHKKITSVKTPLITLFSFLRLCHFRLHLLFFILASVSGSIYVSSVNRHLLNPIQTGLFLAVPGLGGGGASPLHFLKSIKDIDMKLTPLIKRREINLLLLSYLSCDVT